LVWVVDLCHSQQLISEFLPFSFDRQLFNDFDLISLDTIEESVNQFAKMNLTTVDPAHDAHQHSYHPDLLYAGFNQDAGCFACGISNGFIIYNVDPFRETFRRIFPNGGIGIVEVWSGVSLCCSLLELTLKLLFVITQMLFRCNLLAIVGGGRNPRYPTNKVMIWDDHQNKCIGELKFRTEVKAVKLRRDRVVVVLENKVFVYRFKDLRLLDHITTVSNPKGLVSLCPEAKNNVLAIPGLARGTIRIELYDIAKATLIKAHDADLAHFALNPDGSRIASASDKGTLIRIWNCHTGEPMRELRRGMDRAEIYCLSFNQTSSFLACSSDKGLFFPSNICCMTWFTLSSMFRHCAHIFIVGKSCSGTDGCR
jgi:WD repeat-containing protein 45